MASLGMTPDEFERYLDEPFLDEPARAKQDTVLRKRALQDAGVSGQVKTQGLAKAAKKSTRNRRAVSRLPIPSEQDDSAAMRDVSGRTSVQPSVPVLASMLPIVEPSPALPAATAVGALPPPPPSEDLVSAVSPVTVCVPLTEAPLSVVPSDVSLGPQAAVTKVSVSKKVKPKYTRLDFSKVQAAPKEIMTSTVLFRPVSNTDDLSQAHQGLVYKELLAVAMPRSIRDIRGGALAADFDISTNLDPLLAISQLAGITVKPSLPAGQATSAGVVHGLHPGVSEEDFIREASSEVAIAGLVRLAKPGMSSWVVKLSFKGSVIPDRVFYAGRSFRVIMYKPKPMQCFKCFKFGHSAKNCKTGLRCPKCGKGHEPLNCNEPERCPNCSGPHSANNKACPAFSFEEKVKQVIQRDNVTRVAAKISVRAAARTYAEATKLPRQRPEPSRNTIFTSSPRQDKASAFAADIVTAVLLAARSKDFTSLFSSLESLLADFTGGAPIPGALKDLVALRASPPADV